MRRYTVTEVEGWAVDVGRLCCVTLLHHARFKALVDQANAAWELERRYERLLDRIEGGDDGS